MSARPHSRLKRPLKVSLLTRSLSSRPGEGVRLAGDESGRGVDEEGWTERERRARNEGESRSGRKTDQLNAQSWVLL